MSRRSKLIEKKRRELASSSRPETIPAGVARKFIWDPGDTVSIRTPPPEQEAR